VCAVSFSSYLAPVSIVVGGETQTVYTSRGDARDIIRQAGIALDNDDEYIVSVDADSREIEILRAFSITVNDGGTEHSVDIADGTVAKAIEKAGVPTIGEFDMVNYEMEAAVSPLMSIDIDRVTFTESTETLPIPFSRVKVDASSLPKGETRLLTKGQYGEKIITKSHRFVNGVEESCEVVSEEIIREAISEVTEVGTAALTTTSTTGKTHAPTKATAAPELSFTDAKGRPRSYSKKLTGKATAYTAPVGSATSTGRGAEEGVVAVDPKVIPYGTRLYIVSTDGKIVYGEAIAADTGSALRSGAVLVDVFYSTESQCRSFGRRDVDVYILD